ncbi:TetR/AcrR family transcriptional regulator [uncultured Devosia sp.]|mgnify:CR=1 FL=1|jgi:AcrR family transcriptional regulator|uniref:TetR/AcrR family transcriptional regulator n=1 Tax=uncultured Devosia sp. TaxID=211434 RepID=UPI0030EE120F|tara:strand:- start:22370 stop:22999 length:630 start_codon:yes stop_codon:yes gene_type:complete
MTSPKKPAGRVRGRPARSPEQIADMRAHIATCALKLFLRDGYAAISMRGLAQAAGCTAMTLYQYYDSKFAILSTLWAVVFNRLFDALNHIAATEVDPRSRLQAVALGYVSYWLENREHYFLVFMSGGVSQIEVSGFVSGNESLARFDLLRSSLRATLSDEATTRDVRVKTELLLCLLNGIAHNLITIGGYPWADPEILVRQGIDGLLAA